MRARLYILVFTHYPTFNVQRVYQQRLSWLKKGSKLKYLSPKSAETQLHDEVCMLYNIPPRWLHRDCSKAFIAKVFSILYDTHTTTTTNWNSHVLAIFGKCLPEKKKLFYCTEYTFHHIIFIYTTKRHNIN